MQFTFIKKVQEKGNLPIFPKTFANSLITLLGSSVLLLYVLSSVSAGYLATAARCIVSDQLDSHSFNRGAALGTLTFPGYKGLIKGFGG